MIDPLSHAKLFATRAHQGQYYGIVEYTHHLRDVEGVLRRFGWGDDLDMLQAAWLHDTVEDTETKLRDIEENFGERTAFLVSAVTSEKGENRKVRNALTYPKIREAGKDATALKLADRIANVSNGGGSVKMYAKEHEDFKRALYVPGQNEVMWEHLDALFREAKEKR